MFKVITWPTITGQSLQGKDTSNTVVVLEHLGFFFFFLLSGVNLCEKAIVALKVGHIIMNSIHFCYFALKSIELLCFPVSILG